MASSMSIQRSGNIKVTLAVPPSVPESGEVQFSVVKAADSSFAIFIDNKTMLSALAHAGNNGRSRTMWLKKSEIPRFRPAEDVVLRAHFWKRENCLEHVDLGTISY